MYVKVVNGKEKYAQIAEAMIGPMALDRFIVTNQSDMQLMNKLRRETGCGPKDCPVFRISPKSTKQKYPVPDPPVGVELITSVLNVENAMAFNFLVDHASIDLSALCDNKASSEKALLVKDGNGKSSIRGGKIRKVAFLPKGDFWSVGGGNIMMTSNDRQLKQTIGVDKSAAIENAKHELKALHQELARNKEEEKGVKDAEMKHKKAWNVANKEYTKLTSQIKKMKDMLTDLKAEADESEEVPTIDTTDYDNDIQEAEAAVDDLKKKEAAAAHEIETLQPGVEEKKAQCDEVSARNDKIMDDIERVEAKVEDIVKGQRRREEEVDKLRAKLANLDAAVTQGEEIVAETKEKVTKALRDARKMEFGYIRDKKMFDLRSNNNGELPEGEDPELEATDEALGEIDIVEVPQESKHYKAKAQNMLKKIDKEKERRNMSETDPAVAREKYFRAKEDLDSKMKQINTIKENVRALQKDLSSRKKRWRQFRGHIAELTNLGFDEFLNKKGR